MNEQEKEAVVKRFLRRKEPTCSFQFEPGKWTVCVNLLFARPVEERFAFVVAQFGSQICGTLFTHGFETFANSRWEAERIRQNVRQWLLGDKRNGRAERHTVEVR